MNRRRADTVNNFTIRLAADLGRIEYERCLALQKNLVSQRKGELIPDILLFLEHDPPVYTIGRKADPANFPGLEPVRTERGGDITFHGPGQLVIYPIMDMRVDGRRDVRNFVKKLEQGVIDALSDLGFEGSVGDEPGIWVDGKKVASVGLALEDYISFHGISINYSSEILPGFSRIRPCGIDPSLLGFIDVERRKLIETIILSFSRIFGKITEIDSRLFPVL